MSSIEWTDETWNPTVGCTRVSPGCQHCYAEAIAHRGMSPQHRGLTVLGADGPRWTGEVRLVPDALTKPLHWQKPRRVFVNSMSDLFHESIPMDFIERVFRIIERTPQHTYQILTKRPDAAFQFFQWLIQGGKTTRWHELPNVWLGVSVEDQLRADRRIPTLMQCPAAVRFLSVEPMLEEIDLKLDDLLHLAWDGRRIQWVIFGGESGPKARPLHIDWIRDGLQQCKALKIPAFVKQLGHRPFEEGYDGVVQLELEDRKGGNVAEWPYDLLVRDWP